jgi:hypothetical protein
MNDERRKSAFGCFRTRTRRCCTRMFRMLEHVTNMLDSFFLFFGLGALGEQQRCVLNLQNSNYLPLLPSIAVKCTNY